MMTDMFPNAVLHKQLQRLTSLGWLGFVLSVRWLRVSTVFGVILGGCAVGPDFVMPSAPTASTYVARADPTEFIAGTDNSRQHLVVGHEISAEWWHVFHSAKLDRVVQEALLNSPSLDMAQATLAQAQQTVIQVRGNEFPQVDLGAGAERQQGPAFALGLLPSASQTGLPLFNLYTFGPSVSYLPDPFGLTARQIERQQAMAENQRYQLAAAHLTLVGNVVTQALAMAAASQQIHVIKTIVGLDRASLSLTQERYRAGRSGMNEVLGAQSQLASDQALLPPLEQQLTSARNALSVLMGKSPAEQAVPDFELTDFALPSELPISLPSNLVRQRPDILAAMANLHVASATVGVATAEMYPSFPLSASIDAAALSATSLIDRPSLVWTLSGGLTAPIFHGGALKAQKQAAIEAFHASLAAYRLTVLQGIGQVADLLGALGHDAQWVNVESNNQRAVDATLGLQQASYAAGRTGLLSLKDGQRKAQQSQLGVIHAQVQRLLDSAQFFVAMGGGWWNSPDFCTACRPKSAPPLGEKP